MFISGQIQLVGLTLLGAKSLYDIRNLGPGNCALASFARSIAKPRLCGIFSPGGGGVR